MKMLLKNGNITKKALTFVVILFTVGIFLFTEKTAMASEMKLNENDGFRIECVSGDTKPSVGGIVSLAVLGYGEYDSVYISDIGEISWYKDGERIDEWKNDNYVIKEDELFINYNDTQEAGYYYAIVTVNSYEYITNSIMIGECGNMEANLVIENPKKYYFDEDIINFNVDINGVGGDINLKYEIIDGATGENLMTYFTSTSAWDKGLSYAFQTVGMKIIKLTVTDAYGNVVTDTMTINVLERLRVELFIDGTNADRHMSVCEEVPAEVKISGGIGEYSIQLMRERESGGTSGSFEFSEKEFIFSASRGTNKVYVKVTDSAGNVECSQPITIVGHYVDTEVVYCNYVDAISGVYGTTKYCFGVGNTIYIDFTISGESGEYICQCDFLGEKKIWEMKEGEVYRLSYTINDKISEWLEIDIIDKNTKYQWTKDISLIKTYYYEGLYEEDGTMFYYRNGNIDTSFTGIVEQDNAKWYVERGVVKTYKMVVGVDEELWYFDKGKLDETYTGFFYFESKVYYIKSGKVDAMYTGFVKYNSKFWYVNKGIIDKTYVGFVKYNSKFWYVNNGKIDETYVGFVKYNSKFWYVNKGKIDETYTGFVKYNSMYWYVYKGKIADTYTGFVKYNSKYWYVNKGKMADTYTGIVKYNSNLWYIYNGKLDDSYTGFAEYNNLLIYVTNGKFNSGYDGTIKKDNVTYKIEDGIVVNKSE